MTSQKLITALRLQAEKDFQTAEDLFKTKSYPYALFFSQLALEKILKALIVLRKKNIYPPIHSLNKLAAIAEIPLSKEQQKDFDEISSYNIKARYDDIKFSFYKKATKDYTEKWMNKIKEYKTWLLSLF